MEFYSNMSLSPVSIDNGKADYRGRSSSGGSADGIAKKSTTPELAIENYDLTADKNDTIFLESSHSAPNGMVSAPCSHTKAGDNVTDKNRGLSDKISANAGTLQFSVGPHEEINLVVDLNSTPSTWYTRKYSEDMCIPPSTHHSESKKFSNIIISLVNQDDHNRISPSSNIISRPSASSLPGTLVEIPGFNEGIPVLPSSLLTSDVQYDTKPDTMAGASDGKVPQENAVVSVCSERSNAPLADASVQPTGSTEIMSHDKAKIPVNIGSIQNGSVTNTDKVVAFPSEDVVRTDSNENTLKASARKQEIVEVLAGDPHGSDVHEVPMEYEPVEKVEVEEEDDIACADRLPDAQLDDCFADSYVAWNFDLTNPTPSSPALAPGVGHVMKNNALEIQNEKVTGKSGGTTNNQLCALPQILQKMWDETVRKRGILGDISARFDMGIQTMLTEGKMAPNMKSVIEEYKKESSDMMEVGNPPYSGEGHRTMNLKRRLKEAILVRNKCQVLDEICLENNYNWILPRYRVLPSATDGMYLATVSLTGLDFEMSTNRDLKNNPREARESAAADMIHQLHQNAEEERAKHNIRTPVAELPNLKQLE